MAKKLKDFFVGHRSETILFALLLLVISPQFALEYSTDAYHIHYDGMSVYANMVMHRNGRPLSAAIIYFINWMFGSFYALYYISLVLAIVSSFFAVYIVQGELKKYIGAMSYPMALLVVLNPLAVEYFLFTEKGIFLLGVLFGAIAFKLFVRFLGGRWYCLPIASLFIALASFIYQPICAFFVPLAILYICLSENKLKPIVMKTLWAILLYGLGLVFDVIFMSLFARDERMSGIYIENLKNSFFLLGVWQSLIMYVAIFAIIYLTCVAVMRKERKGATASDTMALFLKSSFILVASICATFAPFLLTSPSEVWFPFRIIYPIGVGVFCVSVMLLSKRDFKNGIGITAKTVVCVIIAITVVFMEIMFITRLVNNHKDKELCLEIGKEIEKYEQASGIEIKNISIYYDKNITSRNKGVLKIGDTNVRSFVKDWSDVDSINIYLDRDFARTKQNKEIAKQFSSKNWQEYSTEQLIFVGDTLHLCVY